MSYATLESLIEPLFECFESAGIEGTLVEPMEALPGVFVPDIRMTDTMGRDPDHAMRVSLECEEKHWGYAMTYYLDQPSSVAAFDDELIRERESIRSCLADRGIALDSNASVHEIKVALYEDIVQGVDVAGWAPCYTSSDLLILDID